MAVQWFEVDVKLGELKDQMDIDALTMLTTSDKVSPTSLRTAFYVKRVGENRYENRLWAMYMIDTAL